MRACLTFNSRDSEGKQGKGEKKHQRNKQFPFGIQPLYVLCIALPQVHAVKPSPPGTLPSTTPTKNTRHGLIRKPALPYPFICLAVDGQTSSNAEIPHAFKHGWHPPLEYLSPGATLETLAVSLIFQPIPQHQAHRHSQTGQTQPATHDDNRKIYQSRHARDPTRYGRSGC